MHCIEKEPGTDTKQCLRLIMCDTASTLQSLNVFFCLPLRHFHLAATSAISFCNQLSSIDLFVHDMSKCVKNSLLIPFLPN